MKKLIYTITFVCIALLTVQSVTAQYSSKEVKQTLKMKPPKEVKRQAKDYEKQGYKEAVGATTIERQLTNAWMKEVETDDKGFPRYLFAGATSVGETSTSFSPV